MPEFYMILARKIIKIPEFLSYLPENLQNSRILQDFAGKIPESYIIIARKIFLPNFRGARAPRFVIKTIKRHILGLICVVRGIDRENTCSGFCARRRQEKKGRKGTQSHKWVIFHPFGEQIP